jgi:flagellar motility protein MotE (MotC chaperone)
MRKHVRRKLRSRTQNTLSVLAILFLISAFLRGGETVGQALALAPQSEVTAETAAQTHCETPKRLAPVLAAFKAREARINQREQDVEARIVVLNAAEAEIEAKLAALTDAETTLRETIALAETAAEGDIARLTKVYETMKPKQAAALFEEMAPAFAAGFLARMHPEAAAAIVAGLKPETAHRFSVVLAGRNANIPAE